MNEEETLAGSLAVIEHVRLGAIPADLAAKVVRRIVDNESLVPRLEACAFQSAT